MLEHELEGRGEVRRGARSKHLKLKAFVCVYFLCMLGVVGFKGCHKTSRQNSRISHKWRQHKHLLSDRLGRRYPIYKTCVCNDCLPDHPGVSVPLAVCVCESVCACVLLGVLHWYGQPSGPSTATFSRDPLGSQSRSLQSLLGSTRILRKS